MSEIAALRRFNFGRMAGFFLDVAGQYGFGVNQCVGMYQVDFQAQALQLFDQHVEAFRNFRTDNFGVF